jgi:hypothetical protein
MEENWENKTLEELQMMVSSRLVKDGREIVRVSFFRDRSYADGVLPDAVIEKAQGFSDAELVLLTQYLKENADTIYEQAVHINPMKNWLGLQ